MTTAVNGSSNGTSNGTTGHGLKILIVGAGIGGLSAAIGLRKQGHEVLLFEQSRFASEFGAAIHLAPNSNGILRRLGIRAEEFGANPLEHLTEYTPASAINRRIDLEDQNKIWQHEWLLAHRVHLHDQLKLAATSPELPGKPAQLNVSSRVIDVDVETAALTLEDGRTINGDLIIGADGVHSITRKKISDIRPFGSGKSAFRFLIKREAVLADPITAKFVEKTGDLAIWYGADRRVVMYPTTYNKLLNFVCIHPESESEAGREAWNTAGNQEQLLKIYKDFDPDLLQLLKKANVETLKVWKLLDMEVLKTWTNGKLALLGDAAHPFLPHQGQGGGCALEDAAALSVVLPFDTPKGEIKERLKLYETIRMERAHRIQEYSRVMGSDLKKDVPIDMHGYTNYNVGHDEFDNSTQELRKWTWAKTPSMYWRMPIAFGPMPGPRQDHFGVERQSAHSTFTTASIKFKTSRTLLQNLFPPNSTSYRFTSPGTIAYASFSCTTLNKMDWLGGGGYSFIGLFIHGVEYVKKDGSVVNGTYMPILFENLTDPIVSGREELGMPKLYASIDPYRRENSYRINTGWQGALWGNFSLTDLVESSPSAEGGSVSGENDDGILTYRYMPTVGYKIRGQTEAEYPCFVPYAEDNLKPTPERVWKGKGEFKIDGLDWDALPTLHHIIGRLAELPVYEVVQAKLVQGSGVADVRAAQRLE